MSGLSIFLLLTCGVMLSQGIPRFHGNSNVNTNTNSFRRNYNSNANSNMLNPGYPRYPLYNEEDGDMDDVESTDSLDKMRDTLYVEGKNKDAEVINAAAEAAIAMKKLLGGDDDRASIAVADAVARIMYENRRRGRRSRYTRRNGNYNSNTNTNIFGRSQNDDLDGYEHDRHHRPSTGTLDFESILGHDSETSGSAIGIAGSPLNLFPSYPRDIIANAINYAPSMRGGRGARILRDSNDEEEDEEEDDDAAAAAAEEEGDDDENSTSHDLLMIDPSADMGIKSRRGWNRPNYGNYNSNANTNNIRPYRRNYNSNANKNVFRRNLNSNSNNNSFRRSNVNSNSNNNRIQRGYRYGRM